MHGALIRIVRIAIIDGLPGGIQWGAVCRGGAYGAGEHAVTGDGLALIPAVEGQRCCLAEIRDLVTGKRCLCRP